MFKNTGTILDDPHFSQLEIKAYDIGPSLVTTGKAYAVTIYKAWKYEPDPVTGNDGWVNIKGEKPFIRFEFNDNYKNKSKAIDWLATLALDAEFISECEDFADYMTNLGISSITAEDFRKEEATYRACLENKAKFDKLFDAQEKELLFDWLHENW